MTENTKSLTSKFDHLPIIVQLLAGLGLLLVVAAVGFGALFLLDIVLLDFDPIGRFVSSIAAALS